MEMINKYIVLGLLGSALNTYNSMPAATSSSKPVAQILHYTFIVMFRNSEDIVSHQHESFTTPTRCQQSQICCPTNPEAINLIQKNLSPRSKVKIEDQIRLSHIIDPILPVIAQYIAQGRRNSSEQGFMVGTNQSVIPAIFNLQAVTAFRYFELENNPIPSEWFTQP